MTNGWQEVPLGKVLKRADRFEKKDELQTYRFAGTYSFARGIFAGETKEGSTFRLDKIQRIKKGDFIYCKIMAWEGAFGIAPEKVDDCVMSGAFVAYEVDQSQIDPKFLDYYFKQEPIWKTIGSQSTGTNVRRRSLHPNQFEKATIPLPPLTEQRRIVAHIESLAARVNEAQSLREEADLEAGILLSRATTFAIDEQNWEIRKLETVIKESPRNGLAPQTKVGDSGKKMLRINAVSSAPDRYVDLSAFNIVDVPEETAKPFYMQNDEVFVVRYNGDINRLAKAAIYKAKDDEKVIYPDKLIRLRANEEIITPDYMVYALGSRKVRSQIEELGKTTAGNLGISGTNIKSFMLPVPPLDEQRRIVGYLDGLQAKVNALRELQSQSQEELDALLPSVLDRAFKGEL